MSIPIPLASSDAVAIKVIFWVFVLVVSGIGSLVSSAKKAMRSQTPPRVPLVPPLASRGIQELPSAGTTPPVRPTPLPAGMSPQARAMADALRAEIQLLQAPPPIRQQKKQKNKRPVPPPLIFQPPAPTRPTLSQTAPPMETALVLIDSPADTLRPLLKATNLRNQLMMLEILGKPLALREVDRELRR